MARKLSWVFEIFDKMSRPASTMARELDRVEKELRKTERAIFDHEKAQRRAAADRISDPLRRQRAQLRLQREELSLHSTATKQAGNGWGWFGLKVAGWMMVAKGAFSLVSGLGRGVIGLGSAFGRAGIAAATFKETNLLALSTMLRSPTAAAELMREADQVARMSGTPLESMTDRYKQLTAAGFRGQGLRSVIAASGDLSVVRGQESAERVVTALTQIKAKGRLSSEELMQQLAETGLNSEQVILRIGKRLKLDKAAVMKEMQAGRISSGLGISAILETIEQDVSGGKLGSLATAYAKSVPGMMANLSSAPLRFLQDLDKSPGFLTFKKALGNLVDVLDPETPRGKRIKAHAEDLFNRIFGRIFKQFEDPAAVEAFVKTLLDGFERLIPKVEALATGLGKVVGFVADLGERFGGPDEKRIAHETLGRGDSSWLAADKAKQVLEKAGQKLSPSEAQNWEKARREYYKGSPPHSVNMNIKVEGASGADAAAIEKAAEMGTRKALASAFSQIAIEQGAA